MVDVIVKVSPERDLFIVWSRIGSDWDWIGTEEELRSYMNRPVSGRVWLGPELLDKAIEEIKRRGTNSHNPFGSAAFDDPEAGFAYLGRGILRRANFEAFADLMRAQDHDKELPEDIADHLLDDLNLEP